MVFPIRPEELLTETADGLANRRFVSHLSGLGMVTGMGTRGIKRNKTTTLEGSLECIAIVARKVTETGYRGGTVLDRTFVKGTSVAAAERAN